MALFTVNRFTTDDDICAPDKARASSLLEKLKQRARLKKQEILTAQSHDNRSSDVEDDGTLDGQSEKSETRETSVPQTSSQERGDKRTCKRDDSQSESEQLAHVKKRRTHEESDVSVHQSEIVAQTDDGKSEVAENESSEDPSLGDLNMGTGDQAIPDQSPFTIIGHTGEKQVKKVERVLPHWLSHPCVIQTDVRDKKTSVDDMVCLASHIRQALKDNAISHFFPVQQQLIPVLIKSLSTGLSTGQAGYTPSDICCSAPTGSGKTLAFVIPIIQALHQRVVCHVRALVVLPVRDLATQVFNVFRTYCKDTPLNVVLITGQKTFSHEQKSLVRQGVRGAHSLADIVISTPGRLVDHINMTPGFTLQHLRFLVIDEADRMMEEIKQDWLSQVENAAFVSRPTPGPLNIASAREMNMPLQKLLFSATLSQNPEKLQQLNLFQPTLFTSVVSSSAKTDNQHIGVNKEIKCDLKSEGEFVGKYTTPDGLTEFYVMSSANEKPLMLLYFLHRLKFRNVLCFTKSVEATHRLYLLVKLFGGLEVREFSSGLHAMARHRILKQFAAGKIDVLVCSDAMARGMDVDNVKYVVSYDHPPFIKTYIHRVGRTARAGRVGTAVSLLEKKEIRFFKNMMKSAGKEGLSELKVKQTDLEPLVEPFRHALSELEAVLKAESSRKH